MIYSYVLAGIIAMKNIVTLVWIRRRSSVTAVDQYLVQLGVVFGNERGTNQGTYFLNDLAILRGGSQYRG